MNIRTLSLALIATGCTNSNRYNQGYDLSDDTGILDSATSDDTSDGQGDDGGDDDDGGESGESGESGDDGDDGE